jgi:hypothetical protein
MNSTVHTTQKEEHVKLGSKDEAREKLMKLLQSKKNSRSPVDMTRLKHHAQRNA